MERHSDVVLIITKVKAQPDGYHSITPYLIVDGAVRALEFYRDVFGGKEMLRMPGPEGRVGHAEMMIGDSKIMLADEFPQMGAVAPKKGERLPVSLHLYVPDVDATVAKAIASGARLVSPVENRFYGDRSALLEDPFGHSWSVATHVEDVTPEELQRRAAALGKGP